MSDQFYVEFGTQNGMECNTRYLHNHYGWKGLLMDGGKDQPSDGRVIRQHFIREDNIVSLFQKYKVPIDSEFDLLSVDIDGQVLEYDITFYNLILMIYDF